MQVKHLLLLVVLILLIPPGFYWLMTTSSSPKETSTPFSYDVVKTRPDTISVTIRDEEPAIDNSYREKFVQQLEKTPSWLVQDANFQGCVTKAVDNCIANTTQQEVQLLQSDTLCDALRGEEATNCKNQFNYTKAIKTKDIGLCEKISNAFQRQACQNGVFTQKALESGNARWCDKVSSAAGAASSGSLVSPEKQNCLNLLALQSGAADSTLLNDEWEEEGFDEAVLD